MGLDFKEKLIFNIEKDHSFRSSKDFYKHVEDKYKIKATSDLYTAVTNYQIKKYGHSLKLDINAWCNSKNFVSRKKRMADKENILKRYRLERFLERNEKENVVHAGKET